MLLFNREIRYPFNISRMSTTPANCIFGTACKFAHFGKYHFESNDCADGFSCPFAFMDIIEYQKHMKEYHHEDDAGSKPGTAPPKSNTTSPKAKTPKKVKATPAAEKAAPKIASSPRVNMDKEPGFNRRQPGDSATTIAVAKKSPRGGIYQPTIVTISEPSRTIKAPSPREQLVDKVVLKGVAPWNQRCQGMQILPEGQYIVGPDNLHYDLLNCSAFAEPGYTHCAKHKGQVISKGLRKSGH